MSQRIHHLEVPRGPVSTRGIVPSSSIYRYPSNHGGDPLDPPSTFGKELLMLMAETAPILVRQQYHTEKAVGSAEARLQWHVRRVRERR